MLLYISGSYPENPEGIAAGAKVLLDAMAEAAGKEKFVLLTTNTPVITEHIQESSLVDYELMDNWKMSAVNKKRFYHLLDKYPIDVIHMEYPGDLYGKTFLASFIPLLVKKYNNKNQKNISCNVRLHEFTRARFLRKLAILPILWFADSVYVPAQKDREVTSKLAHGNVKETIIGTNIEVVSDELVDSDKKVISYFGSVYPGKGIEHMLSLWKSIHDADIKDRYRFKIIGDIGTEPSNHFSDYHKQVWDWIDQYGLRDIVEVTGYISDERVSEEIQHTAIATLLYEDGLTLRRGSFLAYLSHGIPIVTSQGDQEARKMFQGHTGVSMNAGDEEFLKAVDLYGNMNLQERQQIHEDNIKLSENFNWNKIAKTFLADYHINVK